MTYINQTQFKNLLYFGLCALSFRACRKSLLARYEHAYERART